MIALTSPRYPLSVMLAVARVLFLLFLTFAAVVQAEEADELTSNPVALTLMDTVEKKLEALEAEDSTGDKSTEELSALYRKAIFNLQSAASYDQITADYILAHTDAPAQTEQLIKKAQEISATDAMGDKGEFENLSLQELEPILLKEKADHAAFEAKLTKNLETLKYHTKRPQIIRQRLIEANIEAEGIADELQQAVNVNKTIAMQEAAYWVRESQAFVLSSEINALNEELLSHLPRIQLIKAKIEQAESNTSYVQGRLERLEQLINNKRSAKASRVQFETARSELNTEGQHHLLRQLAESNTELSQQISKYTLDLKQVEEEAELIDQQAKQIGQDFKKAQQKLDIAGMSKILGRVLQEQRRSLPDTRLSRKKVKRLEEKIADVSLQQLEYKDEYQKLRDLDAYAESYMLEAGVEDIPQLTGQIHSLLTDRNEYLSQLISIQSAYARALSEFDFSQTRLLDAARRYDDFLAKNLLWIRNVAPVSLSNVNAIPGQVHGLLSLANWRAVIVTLWQPAGSNPAMVLILALVGLLLWKRPHMLVALKATGNAVGKPSKDGIRFTLYGFIWTFLLALSWPLLLLGIGWHLQNTISTDVFTKAVSLALIQISEAFLILRMFALLCVRNGLHHGILNGRLKG